MFYTYNNLMIIRNMHNFSALNHNAQRVMIF